MNGAIHVVITFVMILMIGACSPFSNTSLQYRSTRYSQIPENDESLGIVIHGLKVDDEENYFLGFADPVQVAWVQFDKETGKRIGDKTYYIESNCSLIFGGYCANQYQVYFAKDMPAGTYALAAISSSIRGHILQNGVRFLDPIAKSLKVTSIRNGAAVTLIAIDVEGSGAAGRDTLVFTVYPGKATYIGDLIVHVPKKESSKRASVTVSEASQAEKSEVRDLVSSNIEVVSEYLRPYSALKNQATSSP